MVSLTSTNGSEWTSHSLGGAGGNQLYGVNSGRGLFVAVNGFSALTSSDGANWFPHSSGGTILSVAFGNGIFVAVGGYGNLFSSADGTNWINRQTGTENQALAVHLRKWCLRCGWL